MKKIQKKNIVIEQKVFKISKSKLLPFNIFPFGDTFREKNLYSCKIHENLEFNSGKRVTGHVFCFQAKSFGVRNFPVQVSFYTFCQKNTSRILITGNI